jgi:hypothetical protein
LGLKEMKKHKIIKLKNFEGYIFNCNRCGRPIRNPFVIDDMAGIFGSECVYKIFPAGNYDISEIDGRRSQDRKMLKIKFKFEIDYYLNNPNQITIFEACPVAALVLKGTN